MCRFREIIIGRKSMRRLCTAAIVLLAAGCLLGMPGCDEKEQFLPPDADFSAPVTSGTAPLQVLFKDNSFSAEGIRSWLWDFGDGHTSSEQFPIHDYITAGSYTVSLTVTAPAGSDTCTKYNYIRVSSQPLIADFGASPTSGSAPLGVQFTDLSTAPAPVLSWAWDFGDGGTSSEQSPSYTYTADGTFTVSLTVTTASGSDTCTKPGLIMLTSIDAAFTGSPVSGSAPHTVNFTDQSSSTLPVTSWMWNFGDGGTSSAQHPSHTYTAPGTYNVSLTVSDGSGSDTETRTGFVTVSQGNSKPTNGSGGGTGTVSGSYNNRSYRLYVPSSYSDSSPIPVVAAMHGLGDTYTNFFNVCTAYGWKTAADTHGFILMAPAHKNSTRASFLHFSGSTFDPTATKAEMSDIINCIYYGVGASYNVETTEIYFMGFSEGGTFTAMAAYWFSKELHACAPYAGCITGKSFPLARKIPVYHVCGTGDYSYSQIVSGQQEWANAGHPNKKSWVSGVGHSFTGLCTSGPSPSSVYQWMSTVTCQDVVSGLP
jgi:PKD repeat protein